MNTRKWTKEEMNIHIEKNTEKDAEMYSAIIIVVALYMKLYGKENIPDVGLSGYQMSAAESLVELFPDPDLSNLNN